METKLIPLADRIIVKQFDAQEKTESGFILTENEKEKPHRGVVIAVGTGTKDDPMMVCKGDTVLFGKYAGTSIEEEDTFLVLKQSDVIAKISNQTGSNYFRTGDIVRFVGKDDQLITGNCYKVIESVMDDNISSSIATITRRTMIEKKLENFTLVVNISNNADENNVILFDSQG